MEYYKHRSLPLLAKVEVDKKNLNTIHYINVDSKLTGIETLRGSSITVTEVLDNYIKIKRRDYEDLLFI